MNTRTTDLIDKMILASLKIGEIPEDKIIIVSVHDFETLIEDLRKETTVTVNTIGTRGFYRGIEIHSSPFVEAGKVFLIGAEEKSEIDKAGKEALEDSEESKLSKMFKSLIICAFLAFIGFIVFKSIDEMKQAPVEILKEHKPEIFYP